MTGVDREQLRAAATNAINEDDIWYLADERSLRSVVVAADAEFIAAANPATILALLDENDRLRAALEEIAEHERDCHRGCAELRAIAALAPGSPTEAPARPQDTRNHDDAATTAGTTETGAQDTEDT